MRYTPINKRENKTIRAVELFEPTSKTTEAAKNSQEYFLFFPEGLQIANAQTMVLMKLM